MSEDERLNAITGKITAAAIRAHRSLGPALLESAYETCTVFELVQDGLRVEQQKPLPLIYREVKLDCGYRLDLLVEGEVIVEIKAIDSLAPIHDAQLMSYLKLSACRVGLLHQFQRHRSQGWHSANRERFPDSPRSQRPPR